MVIQKERYEQVAPKVGTLGHMVLKLEAKMVRYATLAYEPVGLERQQLVPLHDYYRVHPTEDVVSTIHGVYDRLLRLWHDEGRQVMNNVCQVELYAEWLQVDAKKLQQESLQRQVDAICDAALYTGLLSVRNTQDGLQFRSRK